MRVLFAAATILLVPATSHALIFTDPVAQVQRTAAHAEQMVQSSYMYRTLVETYNNYQAARMTYEMAKAGYEKARNPEEWKALGEYEKMRLDRLQHPTTDPTQSSLFRTVKSLDQAADSYIGNSDLFVRAQVLSQKSGAALGRADQASSTFLELNTPLGEWTSVAAAADAKRTEWDMAHDALLAAQRDAAQLGEQAKTLTSDSFDNAQELEKLKRVEFYAETEYQNDLSQAQSADDPAQIKARQVKVDQARALVEDVRSREQQLERKLESLTRAAGDLQRLIDENNNKLSLAAASAGLDSLAAKLMQEANLSRMADKEVWIKQVSVISFWMLLISLSLALLWKGWSAIAHNDGGEFPHDVVLGLVAAFVFITPGSPIHVQKVARECAIVSDALEMTLYSDSLFKTQEALFANMSQVGQMAFGDPVSSARAALPTDVQDQFDKQMQKMGASGQSGFFEGAKSLLTASSAALGAWLFQLGAAFCSYVGVLAVIISFNLRTMGFWLLVAIAPLLIALAPLPWARRSVLRELGIALYAVIMWGFIARIILLLNNNIAMHNLQMVQNVASLQSPMSVVLSMLDGATLVVLMMLSPVLSYSLARGSFDGLISGAGVVASRAGVQIIKKVGTGGVRAGNQAVYRARRWLGEKGE